MSALHGVGDTGGIVEADWTTINWTKINYMISLGLNPWYRGQSAVATPAVPAGACSDTPPNSQYTCAQQARLSAHSVLLQLATASGTLRQSSQGLCGGMQAGWGKCSDAFMSGFCDQTCGRCTAAACTDTPPNSQYSCAQQVSSPSCIHAVSLQCTFFMRCCCLSVIT